MRSWPAFSLCAFLLPFAAPAADDAPEQWSLHGQFTLTEQLHPAFTSPYQGPQSLSGKFQAKETISATVFAGARLWEGGEAYVNPEMGQGYGFNNAYGAASFPNGEAATAGYVYPHAYMARYFLKQVIALGEGEEGLDPAANQLGGPVAVDRLTLIAGRIYLPDYFDNNVYTHDPRSNFTNWAFWESAAYDFPGNVRGYTNGAVIELNHEERAFRYGVAANPASLGGNDLSLRLTKILSQQMEWEERFTLDGLPGKARLLGFYNIGPMGDFSHALTLVKEGIPAGEAIRRSRQFGHDKIGLASSIEQQVTEDLGGFVRISWNEGATEDWANTDIDRSLLLGGALKGNSWDRADDVVGLGYAVSALSTVQRDFLAAGGLGVQIGDGRLPHYGLEKALEAYYACKLTEAVTVTFDYQFIGNPGFNRDRGPVNVFGGRFHTEF